VEKFSRGWYINDLNPSKNEDFGPVILFRHSFESAGDKAWEIIRAAKS
jgi:hypothetical protein